SSMTTASTTLPTTSPRSSVTRIPISSPSLRADFFFGAGSRSGREPTSFGPPLAGLVASRSAALRSSSSSSDPSLSRSLRSNSTLASSRERLPSLLTSVGPHSSVKHPEGKEFADGPDVVGPSGGHRRRSPEPLLALLLLDTQAAVLGAE